MVTLTLTKGHYNLPDDTSSYVVDKIATIRVCNGWQHIYNNTHYRLSHYQAKRVKRLLADGYRISCNTTLWEVDDSKLRQCPCCSYRSTYIAGCGR